MRTESEVDQFQLELFESYPNAPQHVAFYAACYEACIPRSFWDVTSKQVYPDARPVFEQYVLAYTKKLGVAARHGYSLLLTGDNGAGKTMFMSFILAQVLRRGQGRTAYYTTLTQLDLDLKRGFKDPDAQRRIEHMMSSTFVAIDEAGKEHYKTDSWLNAQLEHWLGTRYDNADPTLLATNLSYSDVIAMYGPKVESILDGRYAKVALDPGDHRKRSVANMMKDMGYK